MGDTVNTAARLMAAADSGTVVASADALAAAAITFRTGARQDLVLKGKTGTLAAFALISESGRREQATTAGPFVGRETELEEIGRLLSATGAGAGATVLVTGPPGIGKTRLLDEARRQHTGPRLRIRA
jgi:adenylate cyclase